jgi:hypothetical protein
LRCCGEQPGTIAALFDRPAHIGLYRGGAQRPFVDTDVVDHAVAVLTPHRGFVQVEDVKLFTDKYFLAFAKR